MHTNDKKHDWRLEHTYAKLPAVFFSAQAPMPVPKPELVCFNEGLAEALGLGFLKKDPESTANFLSGNQLPKGAQPLAQAYAGHQFGHFNRLGDGRAVLLGEQIDPLGNRIDIQLKGSGQTPYSRRGDGKATQYSMLREYLISEAMYHLGIPTTRSLAVVTTGEKVFREKPHDGAVLTRTAASHIRIGTFEYARNFCTIEELKALTNYTLERHYPDKKEAANPALELLKAVMHEHIDLVVDWMRVGFIHGVLNTDNMSITAETIDYGPCAFMNTYDRKTVFSSIDRQGRYAFGNQPPIVQWNVTVLANALLPLISENRDQAIALAQEVIDGFQYKFTERWYRMMFAKLGIAHPEDKDKKVVDTLLELMETHKADYTQVFLDLQQYEQPHGRFLNTEACKDWWKRWKETHTRGGGNKPDLSLMNTVNPKVIPRNHWVENVLETAIKGDMKPFNELLEILSTPYGEHPDELQFQQVPADFDAQYQTFCGT